MNKIAVTAGYRDFGIIFWQAMIAAAMLLPWVLMRGGLPLHRHALALYAFVALAGTLVPNFASFTAQLYLPAGVSALVLSFIPMVALPIAVLMRTDHASPGRLLGLVAGAVGVALIVLPGDALPDRSMVPWVLVALIGTVFYAIEGNGIARWGTFGLSPVQLVAGAVVLTVLVAGPLALARGVFISPLRPWGQGDWAVVVGGVLNVGAYVGYLWLVGRAGAVFAAQVSYLVTGFGVFWAMVLLGERFSPWFWVAAAVIFLGLALVQPRAAAGQASADEAMH
ncbi:MAG: DMT family transporter [Rhodobacteraceae bacterium]|nr:DMT family transporter [Paracoccaceae bacterium]